MISKLNGATAESRPLEDPRLGSRGAGLEEAVLTSIYVARGRFDCQRRSRIACQSARPEQAETWLHSLRTEADRDAGHVHGDEVAAARSKGARLCMIIWVMVRREVYGWWNISTAWICLVVHVGEGSDGPGVVVEPALGL